MRTYRIELRSEARAAEVYRVAKPETIIEGMCEGVYPRLEHQRIHIRDSEAAWPEHCQHCGALTGVAVPWMDSAERWEAHPFACSKED